MELARRTIGTPLNAMFFWDCVYGLSPLLEQSPGSFYAYFLSSLKVHVDICTTNYLSFQERRQYMTWAEAFIIDAVLLL